MSCSQYDRYNICLFLPLSPFSNARPHLEFSHGKAYFLPSTTIFHPFLGCTVFPSFFSPSPSTPSLSLTTTPTAPATTVVQYSFPESVTRTGTYTNPLGTLSCFITGQLLPSNTHAFVPNELRGVFHFPSVVNTADAVYDPARKSICLAAHPARGVCNV